MENIMEIYATTTVKIPLFFLYRNESDTMEISEMFGKQNNFLR